jgi:hypothetical protein
LTDGLLRNGPSRSDGTPNGDLSAIDQQIEHLSALKSQAVSEENFDLDAYISPLYPFQFIKREALGTSSINHLIDPLTNEVGNFPPESLPALGVFDYLVLNTL